VIPEAATRIAAIRTGEVDIVAGLEGDQVRNLQRDGNKLFQADANFVLTMTMNPFVDSPVRDPRVRRAAIASIDRAAIVEGVYAGQANVANQPAPPSANGHDPQMPPQPFDVQQARQLLAEAGFPNGFQSKMHVLSSSQPFITTGTAVAGFLETIGIRVEIEQVSGAAYQTLFNNGPFHPFAVNNYTAPAQDADAQLDWFLSTAPEGRRRYVNPNFDRVLLQSKQEMDATRRTQLLREASRILVTEDPVQAYLVWPIQNYVARPRVENFTALPANFDIDGMFVTR
jgi:peptide/nickel transport system substrate-binding protein